MTTPAYRIDVRSADGTTAPLPVRPLTIEVLDVLGPESDNLRLTLPAAGPTGEIVAHPPHGRRIKVALGYEHGDLHDLGEYVVSAVDFHRSQAGYTIVISADTPEILEQIKAPRNRSWNDISVEDVFTTIVRTYGLEPHIGQSIRDRIAGARVVRDFYAEGESDLAFLNRIGRRYNAQFSIKERRALWLRVGDGKSAAGQDLPRHDVNLEGEGTTWDASYLDRPAYDRVEAVWTNFANPADTKVTVGSGDVTYTMRHTFPTADDARIAAEAQLEEFERGTAELSVSLPGRPEIRAGHLVSAVTRFPTAGLWYCGEAQHIYDSGGLATRLRLTARNPRPNDTVPESV